MKGELFAQIPPLASASDVDVSMDDSHVSTMSGMTTESMLSLPSPPRTQRRKQRNTIPLRSLIHGHGQSLSHGNSNSNNTIRSRLFEDEEDDHDLKHDNNSSVTNNNIESDHHLHHHRSRHGGTTPSILKPIDLNLDFTESESPINNNNSGIGGGGLINNNISNATAAIGAVAPTSPTGRRTSSVNATKSSSLTPHPPSRPGTIALRKRQAEHHDLYGKDWSFERDHNDEDIFSVTESPVDMYTSPRISPYSPSGAGSGSGGGGNNSNYSNKSNSRMSIHRSPFLYGGSRVSHPTTQQQQLLQTHKSPSSFQTIDGRTVQSNNPFSPMIFDETPTPTPDKHQLPSGDSPALRHPLLLVNDSLIFPVSSLSGDDSNGRNNGSGTGGRGSHLVLRHKLQKRASSPSGAIAGNIQHQNHLQHPIAAAASSNSMGIGVRMDGLMPPPVLSKDIILNKKNHNKNNNSNSNNNNNNPIEQRASLYIRDGYPEQTGRYSFTGSPIKEQIELLSTLTAPTTSTTASATSSITEMSIKSKPSYDCCDAVYNNNNINMKEIKVNTENTQEDFCANIHKIRRRRKDDDVVAAAAQGEASWKRKGMYIQTNNKSGNNDDNDWGYYNNNNNNNNDQSNYNYNNKSYYYNKQKSNNEGDNISPTDVINFPAPLFRASPSNSSTVPPAPSKPIRRPPSRRYTPIRKPIGPPPMPIVRKARSFEEEDTSIFGNANDGNDHDRDDESSDDDYDGDDRISNVAQRRRRPKSGGMDYLNMSPREGVDVGGEQAVATPPSRFYSDFDVIAELGSGSFGNVFQALSRLDGCMYAIKVAHRVAKGNADKDRMLKEVYALAALSDQADTATFHIVRYHQAWMEEQRLYIQTELCTTTLQAEMEQVSPMQLPLPIRYKCMREILLALEFIHKNGMVHLDIKPENIFLKNDQFKLGDFGLVSKVSSHDVEEGDSRYMSLELLSGDHADLTKSDIFSLGITMYELCLGTSKALPSNGPKWQSLRSGCIIPPPNTTDNLLQMIKKMMNPIYQGRPCASDLLKLPELLSDEQKMLFKEREKVVQANQALAAQSKNMMTLFPRVPRPGGLVRRNTWSAFT